jgi:endonuclease G
MTPDVPDRIRTAAQARMNRAAAKQQRERVEAANRSGNPLAAEPESRRKIGRFRAVAGVDEAQARALARGAAPEKLGLAGEAALGVERIQGKTADFVGVAFLDRARAAAGCVGRVIRRDGQPVGSGFLVSGRLFLTNNHVIASEDEADALLIEFNHELDLAGAPRRTTRFAADPRAFFVTNPEDDLDFTLVALGARQDGPNAAADFGYCPLLAGEDKHVLAEFVNIIQHPEGDYKQVVLRENQLVSRLEKVLHYVADTSPGSSGSPVFNDQWEVLALHHYGEPFRQTTNADGRPVARELNEGIRISAIVESLAAGRDALAPGPAALLDEAMRPGGRGPSRAPDVTPVLYPDASATPPPRPDPEPAAEPAPTRPEGELRRGDGTITLRLPLEITIRLVDLVGAAGVDFGVGFGAEPEAEAARPGYRANFLAGHAVPFPKLTARAPGRPARLLRPTPGRDDTLLDYEHFSIRMNAERKMAYVTAVNIDGGRSRSVDRTTGRVRPGIAERRGDPEAAEATETWAVDPRIPAEAQTSQALYDRQTPRRLFDRGHLVRREDPNWGTDREAERANADTFHFTNCCPQASTFNQQARYWQGIENHVLDNARAEDARVSVFTGPVFTTADPKYRDVRVPEQFFKVVAWAEGRSLRAVALLASQKGFLARMPESLRAERFDELGAVAQYRSTVAEIEEITGLDFGPLRDADVSRGGESLDGAASLVEGFEDIPLGTPPPARRGPADGY